MKKPSRKPQPLVISIHGEGIHIEATFSDAEIGDRMADALNRMARVTTPPIVERAPKKNRARRRSR